MRHVFTKEERSRGGKAVVKKYGREHMARIGSKGFYAAIVSIAERQNIDPYAPGNPFKNLLRNLKAKKGA